MEVLQTSALPLGYGTTRAGNRARTGDLNLGKVALYQLSYARVFSFDSRPQSIPRSHGESNPGLHLERVAS